MKEEKKLEKLVKKWDGSLEQAERIGEEVSKSGIRYYSEIPEELCKRLIPVYEKRAEDCDVWFGSAAEMCVHIKDFDRAIKNYMLSRKYVDAAKIAKEHIKENEGILDKILKAAQEDAAEYKKSGMKSWCPEAMLAEVAEICGKESLVNYYRWEHKRWIDKYWGP